MRISAIVPVYNSEDYIKRCVDSVLAQTYDDWELILIDDGSKDNSLSIMQEYEKKDSRIHVIHQENAGPGLARNAGIQRATGSLIVFIDSDDRIKEHYFEQLSKKEEDVIFIDINQIDEEFRILKTEYMSKYRNLSKDSFIRQQMTGKINWGGVRKAVKKSLLVNNRIEFSNHKIGEEAIYSFLILFYAESFSFINGANYEYINRPGSQSSLQIDDPWGPVATALKNKLIEIGEYDRYADTINAFIATAAIVSLDKIAQKNGYISYRKAAKIRIQRYQDEIDRSYPVDFKSMNKKAFLSYPMLKIGWSAAIYIFSKIKRIATK